MNARNPLVIHYVHDMDRAREFYIAVFEVKPAFASPGWTELDFGVFKLALHILRPGHDDESPLPHAGLNLEVDQIEDVAARIVANGGRQAWLREPEPHIPNRVASFIDTEGNGFELRQFVG